MRLAPFLKSTFVRTKLAALRLQIAALQLASTERAARAFLRMWLTPVRLPSRGRLAGLPVRHIASDWTSIPVWSLGEGPAVVLAHGWGGSAEQMLPLARTLAASGFRAVLFDGPAHGAAGGRQATGPMMARALAAVVASEGQVRAVLAHSFGSMALSLALRSGLSVPEAIMLAPPSDMQRYVDLFGRQLGASATVIERVREMIPLRIGLPWSALELSELAGRQKVPLLVVHDRNDEEVPFDEGEKLARAWPGASFTGTVGLGHWRILKDPVVAALVVGRLSPRPDARPERPARAREDARVS